MSTLSHVWVEAPFFSDALELFPDDVTILHAAAPPQEPLSNAHPAQAILASSRVQYDAAVFNRLPNLRMVQRTGIGFDNVSIPDATDAGILVCNTPDGPTESTAEHTVAMMLALAKRLKQGNDNLAAGNFGPRTDPLIGWEVVGRTLGLIGLGRIGQRVAQICRNGFDMRVIGYDPFVTPEQAASLGIEHLSMERVIAEADFLSLHVPATAETYRLINAERLAMMKAGAYLLNMARGPLVDPEALLDAVDRGTIGGAGLDVFDPEPPELDDRLRDHPLILATPHSASLTVEGRIRIETMAVERVLAFFRDERPADVLNPSVLDGA